MGRPLFSALLCVLVSVGAVWAADETSSGDKLRILYSNRFTFNNDGVPLVTVEIMGGQKQVTLSAAGGLLVKPDGDGGSTIRASDRWTISLENGSPAVMKEWTVVGNHHADHEGAVSADLRRWTQLGYRPEVFEVGTLFGVEGEIVDTRKTLVAVAPVPSGQGARKARQLAHKHKIKTTVHHELVQRPAGTVIARSGSVVVRNPSAIWFAPARRGGTVTVADVVTGGGGSQLQTKRETRRYFGAVYVAVGVDGKLVAVNAISGDQLLAGLVPSETFTSAPAEALKAQAVAARTELLEKLGHRHFGDPFLLCSTQHCQVYSGAGKEHPRTTRAVVETRGQVLMSKSGELVDARYSSSCGGHAESKEFIWGGEADSHLRAHLDTSSRGKLARSYAKGVDDTNVSAFIGEKSGAYCAQTRFSPGRFRWTKTMSLAELSQRVAKRYPEVGTLRDIVPLDRGRSGRIGKIKLIGSRGKAVARGDLHIRRLLGGLKSTLFTRELVGDTIVFRGAGFGHGVGMCQVGAIGMAEKRNTFRDILYHYYPGSRLRRLY